MTRSHRRSLATAAIAVAGLVIAPGALGVEAKPLPRRDGVVVAWQGASSTAVVVTGDKRVYAVHALRRVAPGTRVRVEGIKWGSPMAGIKWAAPPSGIRWGIACARNGTYASRLTRLGTATTASLRGTVVRRYGRRAVAVSVRGATFVIPLVRGAVWLPGGTVQKATTALGELGSRVEVRLSLVRGRALARRVTQTSPPVLYRAVPLSGRVVAVDAEAGSIVVRAGTTAFPLDLTVAMPTTFDLTRYPVGSPVSGLVLQAPPPDLTLHATAMSLNVSFAQADAPVTSVATPPADPAHVAAATTLKDRWVAARAAGQVPNDGLFASNLNRLERIAFLIVAGDKAKAVKELDQFAKRLDGGPPTAIDPAFRAEIAAAAKSLRDQLAA